MKKLFLFLTLLFVGIGANAQFSPSNNLNYVKLIKTPPTGTTTDQMLVYDGADQFVKMRPVDTDNREAVNDVNKTIIGTANRLIAYTAITADRTVTLPPATTANQRIWITDESGLCSNARRIIVAPNGSDVIGGDAFSVINFPNGSGYLESNGAGKWNIISTTAVQFSAGVNTLPTITDNGNGSVTLGTGVYSLFANANGVGRPKAYQIAGGTFTFVDGSTNYIYADYNTTTGAVTLQQTTTETPLNDLTQTLVYAAYRQGTTLHPRNFDTQGIALSNKLNRSIYRTQRVRFEEGGVLVGESASPAVRTITISAGTVWVAATEQPLSALTSAANTCYHVIQTSPGVWTTSTVVTQYNNTQYNTTAGLQTLNNNEYGVNWLYRSIGTDNDMAIILGGASYTLGQAQSSQKPTNLPPFMRHMELVGRIIVLKNATTATQIDNVSSTFFTASGVTDHNALNNLQTAQAGVTYGHITDGAQTIAGVKTFSSSPIVPTATTGLQAVNKSYVDSITSSGVTNVSTVTGVTDTDALNTLNTGKANDTDVVHKTGNLAEIANGNKNFTGTTRFGNASGDNQLLWQLPALNELIYKETAGLDYDFNINANNPNSFFTKNNEGIVHQAMYFGDGSSSTNIWGISSSIDSGTTWLSSIVANPVGKIGVNNSNPIYNFDVVGTNRTRGVINSDTELSISTTSWNVTYTSPDLAVNLEQGYTSDGVYNYQFGTNRIAKYDYNYSLITNNANPLSGIVGVDHVGQGVYLNGLLYVPVETFHPTTPTNMKIAVYNSTTLALVTTYDISAQNHETTAIGTDGTTLYITSFNDGSKIWKYSTTGTYLGAITLSTTLTGIQGISYYKGLFYLPNEANLYTCNADGTNVTFIRIAPGDLTYTHRSEGLQVINGEIRWVCAKSSGALFNTYYLNPEIGTDKKFKADYNGDVIATSVKFPATQVTNSNANTLDDYEEGTFTPVIEGLTSAGVGTYSIQSGTYTKIGRLVSVQINLTWSAHTGTGNMIIRNLPFISANTQAVASIYGSGVTLSANNYIAAYVPTGTTDVNIRQTPTGTITSALVPIDTDANMTLNVSYTTN